MTDSDFKKPFAEVKSETYNFYLSKQEIKHIRRCLGFFDRTFARLYELPASTDNLSQSIHFKFSRLGKFRRDLDSASKKNKIKQMEKRCSYEGCEEEDNLTIHHIKSVASDINTNHKDNLRLLCPKHHLLVELKHRLWQKGLEIAKISQRIEDIEQKGITDCLGYKVLSKNKFENEDEDE